jgi:nucleoid-associated protein YgaU
MTQITVQQGDTLWDLAAKHLGDPMKWTHLYRENQSNIEREQAKFPMARASMTGPDWIFPGTVLLIPSAP